jgi:hypothetical protein
MKINIKDLVKDNKKVRFVSYREGEFIYSTECGFEFPIPASDLGKATLLAEDKALLFLRYIRRHVDLLNLSPTIPLPVEKAAILAGCI